MTQQTTDKREEERECNNAKRMLVLLRILDDEIEKNALIGIAIWSGKAFDCMLHIETDNKLYRR